MSPARIKKVKKGKTGGEKCVAGRIKEKSLGDIVKRGASSNKKTNNITTYNFKRS